MPYVDIVTVLALVQYMVFAYRVGKARESYGIKAPAITGHEIFERRLRIQQNTLEYLVMLLPGLYVFSRYFNPLYAAALGLVYLIGREVYSAAYAGNPAKRGLGYVITLLPIVVLVGGAGLGAFLQLTHIR